MTFGMKRGFILVSLCLGVFFSGCVVAATPPEAEVAAGVVFEQAGYEFMYWDEGLAIMIWHDFLGDSGTSSINGGGLFTPDPMYKLEGYAESRDGQRFEWDVQTRDGKTAQFWLDDTPYDLSQGTVFIVAKKSGQTEITQLKRDLSHIQPDHASCVEFAQRDADLAPFINNATLTSSEVLPTPTLNPTSTPDKTTPTLPPSTSTAAELEPQWIHFAPGATSATVSDTLPPTSAQRYVLRAMAGQTLVLDVVAPVALGLSVTGANGTILTQGRLDASGHWEGQLPSTQDYVIELVAPGPEVNYQLTVTIPPLAEPEPAMNTYYNAEGGFEMQYSADFEAGMTCPDATLIYEPVICFRLLGDTYYEGTNLIDAFVTVSVDNSAANRSTCMQARDTSYEEDLGQDNINGIPFIKVVRGGVAAGHVSDVTGYRTVRDAACYEVALFLHYSNMGVYEPGTVSEFDEDAVMEKLRQVLYTFRFTTPQDQANMGVEITGVVRAVSQSARIITLTEPVEGFSTIALTEESPVVSAEGQEMPLRDIQPGVMIDISGQPGQSGTLIASSVRLLDGASVIAPQALSFTADTAATDGGEGIALAWDAMGERATICPLIGRNIVGCRCFSDVLLTGSRVIEPSDIVGAYTGFQLTVEAGEIRTVRYAPFEGACPNTSPDWFFDKVPSICPQNTPLTSSAAAQRFEHGQMLWVAALDEYYILFNHDLNVSSHPEGISSLTSLRIIKGPLELKPGASVDNRVAETPPDGYVEPVSGFGLVWRGEVVGVDAAELPAENIRKVLGWAVEPEYGFDTVYQCKMSCGSSWDCYLRGPEGETFHFTYLLHFGHYWEVVK